MAESELLKQFILEYSRLGSRFFRFQSGLFWNGKSIGPFKKHKTITLSPGDVVIQNARRVRSGHPGVPDLIGFTKIKITKDMVGKEVAIFTATEVKTKNLRATKQQINFIQMILDNGGIATVARTFDDVLKSVTEFINGGNNGQEKH